MAPVFNKSSNEWRIHILLVLNIALCVLICRQSFVIRKQRMILSQNEGYVLSFTEAVYKSTRFMLSYSDADFAPFKVLVNSQSPIVTDYRGIIIPPNPCITCTEQLFELLEETEFHEGMNYILFVPSDRQKDYQARFHGNSGVSIICYKPDDNQYTLFRDINEIIIYRCEGGVICKTLMMTRFLPDIADTIL